MILYLYIRQLYKGEFNILCPNCERESNHDDVFCSKCGLEFKIEEELIEPIKNENSEKEVNIDFFAKNQTFGFLIFFVPVAVIMLIFTSSKDSTPSTPSEPSYYDTGDPNDMTNKEMEQYIEWKLKENQKEYDNQKFND